MAPVLFILVFGVFCLRTSWPPKPYFIAWRLKIKLFSCGVNGLFNQLRRGPSKAGARRNRMIHGQHVKNIGCNFRQDGLHINKRQFVKSGMISFQPRQQLPLLRWAWRKGRSKRTIQSAKSVAVAKPCNNASRIASGWRQVTHHACGAASAIIKCSAASKTGSLSSCKLCHRSWATL